LVPILPRKFKPRPTLLDENLSDDELRQRFLDLAEAHCSPSTFDNYQRMLRFFFAFLRDHKLALRTLRSEDLDAFLGQYHNGAGLQYGLVVQNFLNFLGLIKRNNLQLDLPRPKNNLVEVVRRQLISPEELEAFLQACGSDHQAGLMAALLWETGIRVSELVAVRWGDVHLEEGLIELPHRKGGGIDSVPFGLYTLTYLRLLGASGHNPEEPLLVSRRFNRLGTPMQRAGVRYVIRKIGTAAGWRREQCHPHAFRHSCATYLIRKRVPLPAVQQILNHSVINTTMLYTHLSQDDVVEAYRRVMRPDWQSPAPEQPVTPPKCPECGLVRLPGYRVCPGCGCTFAGQPTREEGDLLASLLRDPQVHKVLEKKLRELLAQVET
jgi:integrase